MKHFACGDVVPGCTATFQTETEEELLAQVAAHARDEHGIETVTDDLVAQVRASVTETARA